METTLSAISGLTVGIDARAATEVPAGRGRVVRELLRALSEREDDCRYLLYARGRWRGAELDERFGWRLLEAPDPRWHLRAALAANRECGVFLSTNSYLTTWFSRIPAAPIVHDMIPFEPAMRPNRRSAVIERLTMPIAVRRSAALICTTKATERALVERFPAARGKTHIAPLGPASAGGGQVEQEQLAGLPTAGFVLAVGTLEPRKNLPRLVAAYASLDAALQRSHPLVVVGALGWETGETLQALRSLGDRCIMLGYVSDAALCELYRRCAVFCYPSLGEGFGLPVLEAMSEGAAVVTSNVSCLPEIGGEAAEYVDPLNVQSIAEGMRRVLLNEGYQRQLQQRGKRRAAQFSWERFAEQVLDVLRGVAT